ncbi:hypothetical protein [Nonomuraea fuscirosea]|uniref:hypothetical protein n=1 Tax=Nonomuraea fuscirosea TaxID=1291556 RepID=UPI00343E4E29
MLVDEPAVGVGGPDVGVAAAAGVVQRQDVPGPSVMSPQDGELGHEEGRVVVQQGRVEAGVTDVSDAGLHGVQRRHGVRPGRHEADVAGQEPPGRGAVLRHPQVRERGSAGPAEHRRGDRPSRTDPLHPGERDRPHGAGGDPPAART